MKRLPRAIFLSLWFAAVALYSMWPVHSRTAILTTAGHDLANHVRHVYEAGLALREGQVPPLVCPELEGGTRLPLFQYYSGTSYWAPAVWSLWDANPYRALKVGVFLHVFAGGWAVYGIGRLLAGGDERRDAETRRGEKAGEIGDAPKNPSLISYASDLSASRRLGVHSFGVTAAAVVAATAFQLAPFSSADFYFRGSYTEFCALHAAPGLLYCALRVGRARGLRESLGWVCVCGLAVAYFVPLHPVQTVLCGVLIALLVAVDAIACRTPPTPALPPEYRGEGGRDELRTPAFPWGTGRGSRVWSVLRASAKLAVAAGLGVLGAAWFWWPVVRDYDVLRIVPHGAFLDAGLADPAVLLWPGYRLAEGYPWPPQVGVHFVIAAGVALVLWRNAKAVGVAAALGLVVVIGVVLFHRHVPAVGEVLKPLQWSYRLLVPGTVAGVVCVVVALTGVLRRVGEGRPGRVVVGAAMAWVLVHSVPYFLGTWEKSVRVRNVVAAMWEAPNSTGSYALRGTDYRRLGFVRADGMLNANVNLAVPAEGVGTEVEIVARRVAVSGAALADRGEPPAPALPPEDRVEGGRALAVGVGEREPAARGAVERLGDGRVRLRFRFTPRVGHGAGDGVVRFEAPGAARAWAVEDVTYRAVADDAGMACRVPGNMTRRDRGRVVELEVDVAARREGWYQLPVFVLPSNEVRVNDVRVETTPSANRAMVMVRLGTGRNVVKIRTLPTRAAWGASLAAGGLMVAGAGWFGLARRGRDEARIADRAGLPEDV